MSTFTYNGVTIRPVYTESCRREIIYDGPTYLYTKWTIRVRGVFNPHATSYTALGANPAFTVEAPGFNPAWTDNSVRLMLSSPRGGLFYTAAGDGPLGDPLIFTDGANSNDLTILLIPPPTSPQAVLKTFPTNPPVMTDANNGPTPLELDVQQIAGTKTFMVSFAIEACVNECFKVYAEPAFVLSNRWEMSHDVDENAFTTRTVSGRAIFRTDMMYQQSIQPDDYRAAFMFPCPTNFKRTNVRVSINRDGNELYYSFTDVEQSHNIIKKDIRRIEATATVRSSQGSGEDILLAAARGARRAALAGIREAGRPGAAVPGEGEARGAVGAAAAIVAETAWTVIDVARTACPRTTISMNVRVWGTRQATRKYLESVTAAVILAKIPELDVGFFGVGLGRILFGVDAANTYDLVGRYVEASITLNCGPVTSFALAPTALLQGLAVRFPELLVDDIPGVATTADMTPGMAMPRDQGARGTYVENCVAQALQNICGNPPTGVNVLRGTGSPGTTTLRSGNRLTVPPTISVELKNKPSGVELLDPPLGDAAQGSQGSGP